MSESMAEKTVGRTPGRVARMAGLAFVTGFSGAIMPGPMLALVIGQTAVRGWDTFFWVVTGHALLELALVALLIAGLRAVVARPGVRATVGLVGGAALFYMGGDMLWHARGLTLDLGGGGAAAFTAPELMLAGAVVCLANPYFTGWWATIGMGQLAQLAPRKPSEYLAFYVGHEAADYAWYALIGLIMVTGRRWLTDGLYQGLILLCAVALLGLAAWFVVSGARLLLGGANGAD